MLLIRSDPFERFFDEMSSCVQIPYWRDADVNLFNFSDTVGEVINDDKQFCVQMDVSHFKPEELKVQLDGRELTVEGSQEVKTEHGHSKRSFSKMVLLPEDADLASLQSAISNDGKLQIRAPKKALDSARSIPIQHVHKH